MVGLNVTSSMSVRKLAKASFFRSWRYGTIWAGECADALHPSQLGDHSYFAYLQIEGIDSFYESVRVAGAEICKTIRDEAWGMREFGLVTADGHRIMFAAPIANAAAAA